MPSPSKNPLDSELEATWKYPEALRRASEDVSVAVELGWAAARSVFGKQAKPQHAIDLARLFLEHAAPGDRGVAADNAPASAPTGNPNAATEVDVSTPPAARGRKTGTPEEPPRAPTKIGRPARM